MKFHIDDLPVYFPYEYIYPEQHEYMESLKRAIDNRAHCMLEMPSGTGKTISLLSLLVSYSLWRPSELTKIVYCSRTISEVDKVMGELKNLMLYIEQQQSKSVNFLGLSLSARKNMCINKSVIRLDGDNVDAACRNLTASFVRDRYAAGEPGVSVCDYFEKYKETENDDLLPFGIYKLDDLKEYGTNHGLCPYFLARHAIQHANIIVYSYYYLLDPKIASLVSKDLPKTAVVVFDEAHNIDNVCIETMSIQIRRSTLQRAKEDLRKLKDKVKTTKEMNKDKLKKEYEKLVEGISVMNQAQSQDLVLANPNIPQDILDEAIPGDIRTADNFLSFLHRFIVYVDWLYSNTRSAQYKAPVQFLRECKANTGIARHPLRFCTERLNSIIHNLEISDLNEFKAIMYVTQFATLVSTYIDGFNILLEPFDERTPTIPNPVLVFSCLDASIAIKPIFARFNTVVITSGTLSPLEMYQNILDFRPGIAKSLKMSIVRDCVRPLIVTKGQDQHPISSKFESRDDPAIIRNYGYLLREMCHVVPDGIVCFFPSYAFLEEIFNLWYQWNILKEIQQNKLIFIETQDQNETTVALYNYQQACENGRGAVLLSVARGKVSEGIDFDHHLGRCVIMFGIPFFYTKSRIIKMRMEYLKDQYKILESEYITFDSMRNAAQCLGRVIRGKTDYGLMILADKRYNRFDKRKKLPLWIQDNLEDRHCNLSTDQAVEIAKLFLREMGQPFDYEAQRQLAFLKPDDIM